MRKSFKVLFCLLFACLILQGSLLVLKGYLFPLKYENYVSEYSKDYNVDPMLVMAVMKSESNFNDNAHSKKNAKGLMQITDSTGSWIAQQLGVTDFTPEMLMDPKTNIEFACWYLDNLQEEFHDETLVIAAYNAGRGNVQKWLKNNEYSSDGKELSYIPFPETDKYVNKVRAYKNIYNALYN